MASAPMFLVGAAGTEKNFGPALVLEVPEVVFAADELRLMGHHTALADRKHNSYLKLRTKLLFAFRFPYSRLVRTTNADVRLLDERKIYMRP